MPLQLFSQGRIVEGRISDWFGSLSGATVVIGNKTTLTGKNGDFTIPASPGKYVLTVTHTGYMPIEDSVNVREGVTNRLIYLMNPLEALEDITIVGTRSGLRKHQMAVPVPVDVYRATSLSKTGQVSLTQMLSYAAPTLRVSRESLNEPVTLRNLDPQHVLILVNGIRYHSMAWLYGGGLKGMLGRGSVGNDLNSFPFSAIEKIDILRDGASAYYGSDAIAGVINIQLSKSVGKTSIQLHTGQYYAGDGTKIFLAVNHGLSLKKKGFLNFSATYRNQDATFRGGAYEGTVYKNYSAGNSSGDSLRIRLADDSLKKSRGFNPASAVDNAGNLRTNSLGFALNGGYFVHDHLEMIWTALLNNRKVERGAVYRFPKSTNQVNTDLYPDGFQALSRPTTFDATLVYGIKFTAPNKWRWEMLSSYGENLIRSEVHHSNNASQKSLGDSAPTSFYNGKEQFKMITLDFNATKKISGKSMSDIGTIMSWGLQWRYEKYRTWEGEEASWKNYDPTGRLHGGSQGAGGRSPESLVHKERQVIGAYAEFDNHFSRNFSAVLAGRYEYYGDFGGNTAMKLAILFTLSDKIKFRGSVNNGFRTPGLQQQYINNFQSGFINSGGLYIPAISGTFPNNHLVIRALGIPSLSPEKSINVNIGIVSKISEILRLTVDAYWIQIRDRIVLSGSLDRNIPAVKSVLDSIPGIRVDRFQFLTNAIHTQTRGIDITVASRFKIARANLSISLATNFNSTKQIGEIKTSHKLPATDPANTDAIFSVEERTALEKGQPGSKIILSVNYNLNRLNIQLRNTRFGKTEIMPLYRNPTGVFPESFNAKWITDFSASYKLGNWCALILGANNIFNVYPDKLKHYENTVQGSWIYSPEASPFGFNGGYYFIGTSLSL